MEMLEDHFDTCETKISKQTNQVEEFFFFLKRRIAFIVLSTNADIVSGQVWEHMPSSIEPP